MKIVSDTLEAIVETWSDPGDYPSGAGSGPLPSYNYVEAVEGEIIVEIEQLDRETYDPEGKLTATDLAREWIDDQGVDYDLPHGIHVAQWDVTEAKDGKIMLVVKEFEAGEVEAYEPEWEPDDDYDFADDDIF